MQSELSTLTILIIYFLVASLEQPQRCDEANGQAWARKEGILAPIIIHDTLVSSDKMRKSCMEGVTKKRMVCSSTESMLDC